jgi:hypothetical protein
MIFTFCTICASTVKLEKLFMHHKVAVKNIHSLIGIISYIFQVFTIKISDFQI